MNAVETKKYVIAEDNFFYKIVNGKGHHLITVWKTEVNGLPNAKGEAEKICKDLNGGVEG